MLRVARRLMSNIPENLVYGGVKPHSPSHRATLTHFRQKQRRGDPITVVTAYDYPSAVHIDAAGIDVCLVGGSAAMVVHGHDTTLPISLDKMLLHCRAVARGASHPLLVGDLPFVSYDLPFLSYEFSSSQAVDTAIRMLVDTAIRMLKEGRMDAIKLEGGAPSRITAARSIVEAGIAAGHVGLTPEAISVLGGFRRQGKTVRGVWPSPLPKQFFQIPTIGIGAGPFCSGQIFYSLTKEEKNLLLKFEEHIKYSPDYDNCSAEAIESLRRRFFLPEDLIVNGIKRKINQFKMAENQRKFSDVVNFLLSKNYVKLKSSILVLLRQLKEESMFSDLDDDILKEALGVYVGMLQSFGPNVSSADFRKHYKPMLKQRIDVYLENGHDMMKMLWEIKNKDYFYYGTLKFPDRTAMKLGNMERKIFCKQSRWGKDDSRLSKRRNTFGDCLDERDVDEILLEIFVIEKEIIRINSMILSSYMKRRLE